MSINENKTTIFKKINMEKKKLKFYFSMLTQNKLIDLS